MKSNLETLISWLGMLKDDELNIILNVRRNELIAHQNNNSYKLEGNYEYSGEQWTKMIIHYGEKEIRKRKLNKINNE